jgi:DNA-nicking Smr family endonuclease
VDSSDEDQQIWKSFIKNVTPLKKLVISPVVPSNKRLSKQKESNKHGPVETKINLFPINNNFSSNTTVNSILLNEITIGKLNGIERKKASKLKSGDLDIEGKIDLHGHTLESAYMLLTNFINNSYNQGKRNLLVITGKGIKKDGRVGLIKQSLVDWLNNSALKDKVLAVTQASVKHGGEGAFYIYLRKKK